MLFTGTFQLHQFNEISPHFSSHAKAVDSKDPISPLSVVLDARILCQFWELSIIFSDYEIYQWCLLETAKPLVHIINITVIIRTYRFRHRQAFFSRHFGSFLGGN